MDKNKTKPTATKLLYRVSEIFDKIDSIAKLLVDRKSYKLSVRFYHDEDLKLLFTKWSDRHDGDLSSVYKRCAHIYEYEVSSNGIHFTYYGRRNMSDVWHNVAYEYRSDGYEGNLNLMQVPNKGPSSDKTMYIFHQEKIRETLSVLPAWATVCGVDY